MSKNKESVVTLDYKPFLVPVSIFFSALVFSVALLAGLNNLASAIRSGGGAGTTTTSTTTATEPGKTTAESSGPKDENTIVNLAGSFGADINTLNSCIAEGKYTAEVENDFNEGVTAGVGGTPSFVVGVLGSDGSVKGELIAGAYPYETFAKTINKYLNDASLANSATATTDIDDDVKIGNTNAKVAIVEFSDYNCSYCQRFHQETFDQIKTNFVDNNQILYVYRDFPGVGSEYTRRAAAAAECFREQKGDKEFINLIKSIYGS